MARRNGTDKDAFINRDGGRFSQLKTNMTTEAVQTKSAIERAVASARDFYVYRIATAAASAGFLFGFDTAIINGALIFVRQDFHLNELQTEFAAGSLLIGCLFGAGGAGTLSDRFGRRCLLLAAAVLFGLSSIGTALPRNLYEFVVARLFAGVAIGVASVIAPMYIAEISPPQIRGRLVSLNQMAIVLGILSAFSVSWMLSGRGESSWRLMFATAVLPSLAFLLALFFVPESPRWLIRAGYADLAMEVLQRIRGDQAATEAEEIQQSLAEESGNFREMLTPHLRRPLFIAIALAVLSQATGINSVNYYGAILFRDHAGQGTASSALGANVIVGLANLAGTILALSVIDRVGRKALLLVGSAGMAVTLSLLGFALRVSPPPANLILTAVLFYVGLFAISFAPVTWVCIAELFPTAIRGRAMSAATVALWAACLLVSLTFLSLMKLLSPGGTFWLFASVCFVAFLFVWRWLPETKGRSLEEIQHMWKH